MVGSKQYFPALIFNTQIVACITLKKINLQEVASDSSVNFKLTLS